MCYSLFLLSSDESVARSSWHKRLYLVLSGASIRREHHKSAMSSVMKMNDSLGMSKEADVGILLPYGD